MCKNFFYSLVSILSYSDRSHTYSNQSMIDFMTKTC